MDSGGQLNAPNCDLPPHIQNPSFFSPETGIYHSKCRPAALPQDPFTDLVSFVFSRPHRGVTALVDAATGSSISYSELRSMSSSLASGLIRIGVASKDVVLVILPNTILFPVVFFGALSAGAVFSAMNPLSTPNEIGNRTRLCRCKLIFTAPENVTKLVGLGIDIVTVPEETSFDPDKFALFKNLVSGNPSDGPRPVIRQTDTAAVLFSSGTTGESKGVALTHANLIAGVELFVRFEASQYERESWTDVHLAAIPMFHIYGLTLFSMGLLSLGSAVVVMRRFDVYQAVRVIDRYRVTHFNLVPTIMAALVRAKGAGGSCLQSLLQVSCGAAPLSRKAIDDFLNAYPHVDLIQGYGLTESAATGSRGFNTIDCTRHSSVGLLAPNTRGKIIDIRNGSSLPPGNSGELLLKGPGIMKELKCTSTVIAKNLEKSIGYLNDEIATASTIIEDGWLKTGDIAYFDQDGYLFILDRLKETIKYKGFQIAPVELEELLITHPEVQDAAVTSAKDAEAGEIPVAFIVRKAGSNLSSTDIIHFVAKRVTPYKKVRKVLFVNSVPRSAAGKILRRELRDNLTASRM